MTEEPKRLKICGECTSCTAENTCHECPSDLRQEITDGQANDFTAHKKTLRK